MNNFQGFMDMCIIVASALDSKAVFENLRNAARARNMTEEEYGVVLKDIRDLLNHGSPILRQMEEAEDGD